MSSPHDNIPKAVLYYDLNSIWSCAVRIVLEEKGYGQDELDLKIVDLSKGENFSPAYLRLSPKGLVPTLVVPFQDTLSADTESRYKAITDVKDIIEFLDRSRSAQSHTHTTSYAPAPSLSPATIALSSVASSIIRLLHSGPVTAEHLFYFNAGTSEELQDAAKTVLPFAQGRRDALERYLAENERSEVHVSDKTKSFWLEKKRLAEQLLPALTDTSKSDAELSEEARKSREEYLTNSRAIWGVSMDLVLTKLNKEFIGPLALGDQYSIVDVHLTAYLVWLVKISGGSVDESGRDVIKKLEKHIGGGFSMPKDSLVKVDTTVSGVATAQAMPESKLAVFWDAVKERESWKKVYGGVIY